GRSGSFVLLSTGAYADGEAKTSWQVVEGSGTGDLAGLRGQGSSVAASGLGEPRPGGEPVRRAVAGGRQPGVRRGSGGGRPVGNGRRCAVGSAAFPRPAAGRPAAAGARADVVGHRAGAR